MAVDEKQREKIKQAHKMLREIQRDLERCDGVDERDVPMYELLRQDAETLYYLAKVQERGR